MKFWQYIRSAEVTLLFVVISIPKSGIHMAIGIANSLLEHIKKWSKS